MSLSERAAGVLLTAAGMISLIQGCRGCTPPEEAIAPPAAADAVAEDRKDASRPETVTKDVDAASDPAVDVPMDGVPQGWQAWTDWAAQCPIFVPGPDAAMPPPIEWEACPAPVPSYLACKRMKITWGGKLSTFPKFWRDPATNTPLLLFSRHYLSGNYDMTLRLVAEADGPVRMAQLRTNATEFQRCNYLEEDVADGWYVLSPATRTGPMGPDGAAEQGGLIGAPVSVSSPQVLLRADDADSSWTISSKWIVQLGYGFIKALSWDTKTTRTISNRTCRSSSATTSSSPPAICSSAG